MSERAAISQRVHHPSRYIEELEPELTAPGLPPSDAGVYCTDCPTYPFVAHVDLPEHDRWHVEMAAHLDTTQVVLFR